MRVLISGAGVAGPSLAWFLAKMGGIRTTVVEKAPAILAHGQNVDIQGSARNALRKMGLLEEVLRHNTTEKGTQFIDSKGRPFAPFPVKEGKAASMTSEFEILRADLANIMYDATKEHPNVDYIFGTTVKKVISNDEKAVKVELSNGSVQEYDLLVAADGAWSKVRKQCFPPEDVTIVDKDMYCVYYTIPKRPGDNDWWNVYNALGSKIITLRPDPHGTIRAMFTLMPCNGAQRKAWQAAARGDRQTQEELTRKEFAGTGWQAQRLLDEMEQAPDFYLQAIQQVRMTKWSTSRVVCLGDAGYAPTPLTGMGTSLAILGAWILAGEISKLGAGEDLSKALQGYENTFRPFVEQVQEIPRWFPDAALPETAFKRWILHTVMSTLSWIASVPWIVNRFDGERDEGFPLPQYPTLDAKLEKVQM